MLNPFPIQFLAPLAYMLLRIVLGFICVRTGFHLLHASHTSPSKRMLGLLLTSLGTLLILGLSTQIAALGVICTTSIGLLIRSFLPSLSRTSLLLMTAIALSLFITGAGPFAFDLPI